MKNEKFGHAERVGRISRRGRALRFFRRFRRGRALRFNGGILPRSSLGLPDQKNKRQVFEDGLDGQDGLDGLNGLDGRK